MIKSIYSVITAMLFMLPLSGQDNALTVSLSYTGETVNNLSGGMRSGGVLAGMVDLSFNFMTESANLWQGGELCLEFQNTHGGTATATFIGDIQVASNIENGNYSYLYQFWYKQNIGNFSVLAGIHDLNSEFLFGSYALEYLNSSLGIMPTVSLNVPVSIFPKTSYAVLVQYSSINNKYLLRGAVYEGDPRDLDTEEYNLDFSWNSDKGNFYIVEAQASFSDADVFKIGGFYHDGEFEEFKNPVNNKANYGLYIIAEKQVWEASNKKRIGIFAQTGWAPNDRNVNPLYFTAGTNFYGFFLPTKGGRAGVCLAYAGLSNDLSNEFADNETVMESFLALDVTDWLTLKQDFQYIINCGGLKTNDNAFVSITRLELSF